MPKSVFPMIPPPATSLVRDGRTYGCSIGRAVLPALDEANRTWLAEALAKDSGWSNAKIAAHLTAAMASVNLDVMVATQTVLYHRNGQCSCRKAGLA